MKKNLKYVINAVVIIVLLGLTFYVILDKQDIDDILKQMRKADPVYLILGVIFLLIFVCSESVIFKYLFKKLKKTVSLIKCIKYSFIGFFFCCITPSASGGQPMQIYWMNTDSIDVGTSTLVIVIVTMVYKIALILLSALSYIFNYSFVSAHIGSMLYVFIIGCTLNAIMIAFLALLIYNPILAGKMVFSIIDFFAKIKIIRKKEKWVEKAQRTVNKYKRGAVFIRHNTSVLFNVLWMTIVQRVAFFAIAYMVYLSLGLSGTSFFEVVALQTVLSLALDILPLPGGIGANESGFAIMYNKIFAGDILIPGMLLCRGINFYLLLLIGGIVTISSYVLQYLRRGKTADSIEGQM